MGKYIMLFTWFLKFGFLKPRDEYNMHDYIRDSFCPEFIPYEEFEEKEQLLRDTPGPSGIKYAYYTGNKIGGILGAVISIFAMLLPVVIFAVAFFFLYTPLMNVQVFNVFIWQKVFNGMHAAVLGLVIAHVYKIMYFNNIKRKSMIFILPAALIFIFAPDILNLSSAVLMPYYMAAIIIFGVIFGIIHVAAVKYREKHPKYIDPYSKKAKKLRDRQIMEEEYNMKRYIDDDTMKRRREKLEAERLERLDEESKNKIHKGEE